ncbi:MAG TPA: DNA-protecting protein DprA, partial [Burkholderiaceae bacterium]|nr:DNA-protecting protein DprA [Burkholderiaceae bacterium]
MVSHADKTELAAWLRLTLEPDVGPVRARALLAAFGLPPQIFDQPAATLRRHVSADLAHQLSLPPSDATLATIDRT